MSVPVPRGVLHAWHVDLVREGRRAESGEQREREERGRARGDRGAGRRSLEKRCEIMVCRVPSKSAANAGRRNNRDNLPLHLCPSPYPARTHTGAPFLCVQTRITKASRVEGTEVPMGRTHVSHGSFQTRNTKASHVEGMEVPMGRTYVSHGSFHGRQGDPARTHKTGAPSLRVRTRIMNASLPWKKVRKLPWNNTKASMEGR